MNKRKILIGCIFVILGLAVGAVFVTATSYFQLAIAILIYPLLAFFFFKAFPRGTRVMYHGRPVAVVQPPLVSAAGAGAAKGESVGVVDIDKRAFLKLIGGAGLSLFLFSIFNKRVENLFSRSFPTPSEKTLETTAVGVVDPSQHLPMYGYTISEIDDNVIAFYGFTNKDGAWFIMREDTNAGSFRYARGDLKFPNNWANRENLNYNYYSKVFKN